MSNLSDRLRDLVPHVRGTGLDGRGHALVREASDALDAMEVALRALIADSDDTDDGIIPAPSAATLAQARQAIAKLEGK